MPLYKEKNTTCQVTIQDLTIMTLLDTGDNISVMLEKFFNALPQKPTSSQIHKCKITSASGANIGPIGQCSLTFQLENKHFMDMFIVLQHLKTFNLRS